MCLNLNMAVLKGHLLRCCFFKGMNRYEEHARLILKRCFEILDVVLIIFCLETRNFYHMVPQRMIGPRMAHSIQGRAKAT